MSRLVLTLRRGQGVTVDIPHGEGEPESMHLQIEHVEKGEVRVAFEAPTHISIIRDQLLKAGFKRAAGGGHD
ncbi:carbon storage regulator (plasmid) [Dyella sp. BiH032]|uniref:carbon storage regulator n=1 Tax=Dyella sp. BiH032 TaxID=3075430 RepID=UPI0028935FCA|nr:carbon storage regulator [Dyella sp. BiH032]WNL48390.1 carbon storage regulator [Dyella sp. BiH032]